MKNDVILIVGASGSIGKELLHLLTSEQYQVRTTTSKTPVGANAVHLNLATGEGIVSAFEGVDKAFLLSPPGYVDQFKLLSPLIKEARKQNLKKVVLLSALGADLDPNSPFRRLEMMLEDSGLNYNIVRPNWFFQNFNTYWLNTILEQNKILLPVGQATTSFIDTSDIAAVVATLLTTNEFNNQAFDLTGPEALTHDEVAQKISKIINKTILFQNISPELLKKDLLGKEIPEDYADFMLLILSYLKAGYNSKVTGNVEHIIGRPPRNIDYYVQKNHQCWL